jgi:hypothetical protein
MAVHVDEIHTQVSAAAPGPGGDQAPGSREQGGAPAGPGATEDAWRRTRARVAQLRCRVAAEDFDD